MRHHTYVGVVAMMMVLGCIEPTNSNSIKSEVPVTEVYTKDITTELEYVADVHAIQNVEIRARVEGYLEQILIDEGKEVTKGQLLFKINEEEYRAHLNSAKANLSSAQAETKSAEVELERVKLLVAKNVITKTELDLAMAKLEISKAKIEQAKAEVVATSVKLAHTSIRSPFHGVIDRIPYKQGSLISAGTLVTTLSDISAVNIYFKVSEIEYLEYFKQNQASNDSPLNSSVELVLADGSTYPFAGKIETMESEFEQGTGALAIRARFKNPNKILKHGSTGKIRVKEQIKGAIIIPQKSTLEIQDKTYVFIVDENDMVVMKSFEPLQRFDNFYLVKNGLKPGQRIVYEGVQNLREGSVIIPKYINTKEVYTATP
jgi:membrane fusion protein, multidrug efflux system